MYETYKGKRKYTVLARSIDMQYYSKARSFHYSYLRFKFCHCCWQTYASLKIQTEFVKNVFTLIALFGEKDKIERLAENVRRKRNAGCELSCTNDRGLLPKVGRMSLFPAGCRKLSSQESCANSARACLRAALICCLKRFCPSTCNATNKTSKIQRLKWAW